MLAQHHHLHKSATTLVRRHTGDNDSSCGATENIHASSGVSKCRKSNLRSTTTCSHTTVPHDSRLPLMAYKSRVTGRRQTSQQMCFPNVYHPHLNAALSHAVCAAQLVIDDGALSNKLSTAQHCHLDASALGIWHKHTDLQQRGTSHMRPDSTAHIVLDCTTSSFTSGTSKRTRANVQSQLVKASCKLSSPCHTGSSTLRANTLAIKHMCVCVHSLQGSATYVKQAPHTELASPCRI
jgi:hypothetical protein